MVSKIIRADGTTELASIKSVTYHESVNADIDLRPGCVASNYIEVTCFGQQTDAPSVGEALTYYQVVGETETLIGIFYAEPSIPTKNSYSFVAYDAVHKLDAGFSAWLSAHQEDFPYTVYQLVSQACSIAGVTLGTSSWANSAMEVNAWYADGLTCRNILQYAAEIACKFVRCNTDGEIVFDWYKGAASGETKTASGAIATFDDGADRVPLKSLTAQIDPVQDLHGQDAPYPPGGGKNKLPNDATTSTIQGVTFTVNADKTITANGTSTGWTGLTVSTFTLPAGEYKLVSLVNPAYAYNYYLSLNKSGTAVASTSSNPNGVAFTLTEETTLVCKLFARPNNALSNLVCYPMIILATETDVSYLPYSNICPISGWTGLEGQRTGVNVFDKADYQNLVSEYDFVDSGYRIKAIPLKPNKTVTVSITPTQAASNPILLINNVSHVNERGFFDCRLGTRTAKTFTLDSGGNLYIGVFSGATNSQVNARLDEINLQIEYSSTASSYKQYQVETLSVSWQDEAGTVYGGDVVINEDGSCTLTADKYLYVYDGTESFSKSGTALNGFYNNLATSPPPHNWPKMINYGAGLGITDERSSMFIPTRNVNTYKQNYGYVFFDSGHNFDVPPETFGTTVASFKAKLVELYAAGTPVSVFCKIAEPIVYTLPSVEMLSTVLGTNNILVTTGDVEVEYYQTLGRIYPSSGMHESGDRFAYKQDGLNYDNYDTSALARVAVHPVGEDDVAYYYPADVQSGNTLDITNNALLYGASAADMTSIAQTVYDGITAVGQYRPMDVSMFPNECPFRSGQIVPVTDAQGVSFITAIMSKVVTDSAVTLASTGREVYGDYALDTAKRLVQLAADIVRINKLKVDWAEIDEIFARDITVTGQLHSEDYSYTDGEIYANQGMGMDFGAKRFNTPNFGITPDGDVYAQGGKISGFNIRKGEYEEVIPSAPTYTNTGYSYADGYLTVTQAGTATFDVPMSYTVGGVTKPLTRVVYQCYWGTSSSLPAFYTYYFTYVGTGSGQSGMVQYVPVGDDSLNSIIPNGDLLLQSTSLSLSFALIANSSCRIFFQYGNYYSLYTENQKIGTGKSNVYVGDDGISVGESIILTPDGNAKIETVEVGNARALRESLGLGENGMLPITIGQGGTGSVAVETTTTAADIATAESGYTLTATNFAKWGKVAMANVSIKKSTAVTTDSNLLIATLVSDKRPVVRCGAVATNSNILTAYVEPNGEVHIRGTVPANTTIGVYFTYLLP